MLIFALYIPKPEELTASVIVLVIAFAALCGLAYRLRLSLVIAAPAMLLASALAVAPDLWQLWGTDLGDYGDLARDHTSSHHSDTYFAITSYLYTGRGKIVAFGGMATALLLQAVVVRRRRAAVRH